MKTCQDQKNYRSSLYGGVCGARATHAIEEPQWLCSCRALCPRHAVARAAQGFKVRKLTAEERRRCW